MSELHDEHDAFWQITFKQKRDIVWTGLNLAKKMMERDIYIYIIAAAQLFGIYWWEENPVFPISVEVVYAATGILIP